MIELQLSNTRYIGFEEVTITRDIENFSGSLDFATTTLTRGTFPVKRREKCVALINGVPLVTGFVDKINVGYDKSSHTIRITGRDKTADIIDSSLDAKMELKTPISLVNVIQNVLNHLGITDIKIINQVGTIPSFGAGDLVAGEIGENAFDFLDNCCAKRQVLLTTDGKGNVVITRGEGVKVDVALTNKINGFSNNVFSADVTYDDSKRYYHYIVKSQGSMASYNDVEDIEDVEEAAGDDAVSVKGEDFDPDIRKSRVLVIKSDTEKTIADCIARAKWEKSMRRARSLNLTLRVQGHTHPGTNNLWLPFQVVRVVDDFGGVDDELIIKKIQYKVSLGEGNISIIEVVPKDTFLLLAQKEAKKKKKGGSGVTDADIKQVKYELQENNKNN